MSVFDSVGVKSLVRGGLQGNIVRDLGAFLSLSEAQTAVANGHIVPKQGQLGQDVRNLVLVMDSVENKVVFYEWSFLLNDFTVIGHGDSSGNIANAFIRLTGSDEYIGFDSTIGTPVEPVGKWTTDWTLSFKVPEINNPELGQYVTLFSNGNNNILLRISNSNYGLYVNGDTSYQAGINVWSEVAANDRLMFIKSGTGLKYYINGLLKGTINLSSYVDGSNGLIKIGEGSADRLKGGIDSVFMWDKALTTNDIHEVFNEPDYTAWVCYADAVAHLKCGEDTYPTVVDYKGNLTGGELFNGQPADFVPIV